MDDDDYNLGSFQCVFISVPVLFYVWVPFGKVQQREGNKRSSNCVYRFFRSLLPKRVTKEG